LNDALRALAAHVDALNAGVAAVTIDYWSD
jgi:hypothetical protein